MSSKKQATQPSLISLLSIVMAVFIAAAVITQFTYGVVERGFDAVNFLSFFTIESNLLACVVLIIGALVPLDKQPKAFSYLRGVATLCMVTTGIVYGALLSGLEESLQTTIPWVNVVLHYIAPLVVFTWWVAVPPKHQFNFKHALLWLIVPFIYVGYSLIRGPFVHWYPYPFLDPTDGGYSKIIVMGAIIFVALVAAVGALTWLSQTRRMGR